MIRKQWWKNLAALAVAALLPLTAVACGDSGNNGNNDDHSSPAPCAHEQTQTVTLTAATCTKGGKTKTVCKTCETVLSETETVALGHNFGEWHELRAASCSEYGKFERNCVRGCKEYDYADKLTHTALENGKCSVCKQTAYSLGLEYTLSDDGEYYSVAMGDATDEHIVIPATWEKKPVKAIADEGFAYSTTLKKITVPESIEKIHSGAFNGSNALTEVYWNARACADFADRNWAFLRSDTAAELHVTFGRSVERIPARMFFPLYNDATRTPNVTGVSFEEGSKLQSVGDYAFYQTPITAISLPDGVKRIGAYAFASTPLTSFRAVGLSEMGDYAFCNCQELLSIELGGETVSFGTNVFDYCIKLQKADLSALRGTLGASLFKNCYQLEKTVFADGVKVIPARAFYGCKKLQSVVVPDSATEIGAEAFVGCENVRSITIGKNVKTLGNAAFSGLTNVNEVYYNAIAAQDLESGNGVFFALGEHTSGVRFILGAEVERLPARLLFPTADASALPKLSKLALNAALSEIGDYALFGIDCTITYAGTLSRWQSVTVGTHNDGLASLTCKGGN